MFEKKKKNGYLVVVLLAVLLLGLTVGGVAAFLSMSSGATNTFTKAEQPGVSVSGTAVTVDPKGYSVYLRVAVEAGWELNGVLLPDEATEYTVSGEWKKIGDFYYYPGVISGDTPVTVTPVSYQSATKDGYSLTVNVAAQIIQAVGETDGDDVPAVQNAWGVTPEQITGN